MAIMKMNASEAFAVHIIIFAVLILGQVSLISMKIDIILKFRGNCGTFVVLTFVSNFVN